MRTELFVLVDDNGLADQMVGAVTNDPAVADLWVNNNMGHVEQVNLNQVALTVDARGRFFKQARKLNSEITK